LYRKKNRFVAEADDGTAGLQNQKASDIIRRGWDKLDCTILVIGLQTFWDFPLFSGLASFGMCECCIFMEYDV